MMTVAGSDQVTLQGPRRRGPAQRHQAAGLRHQCGSGPGRRRPVHARTGRDFAMNGSLLGGLTSGISRDTHFQPQLVIPCSPGVTGTCYGVIDGPNNRYNIEQLGHGDRARDRRRRRAEPRKRHHQGVRARRPGPHPGRAQPDRRSTARAPSSWPAANSPCPSGRDHDGNVTIEFKPYGVGLGFRPVVLSGGRISLQLSTEVSELTRPAPSPWAAGTADALSHRRPERAPRQTTVELPVGRIDDDRRPAAGRRPARPSTPCPAWRPAGPGLAVPLARLSVGRDRTGRSSSSPTSSTRPRPAGCRPRPTACRSPPTPRPSSSAS